MTDFLQLSDALVESVDPALLRATNSGHFTSMEVQGGRVHGLDLHLERLDRSSLELFGQDVPADRVLSCLRLALDRADSADVSIRVKVFTRERARLDAGTPVSELLITVGDPLEPTPDPPRLLAVEHERVVPHLKHTGTFPLVYFGRPGLPHQLHRPRTPRRLHHTSAGTTKYGADSASAALIAAAFGAVPPQEI